jgi:hypothetical protein
MRKTQHAAQKVIEEWSMRFFVEETLVVIEEWETNLRTFHGQKLLSGGMFTHSNAVSG